ncbi:hypothetical protein VNO78_19072 [Psophocarpus tetragonolobus]|uniref:Uncharacterized protein n=1 Tax=Psophocarpus tetragonolobus TaxID=3891 RepID=A0AAN9XGH3_PSOTE
MVLFCLPKELWREFENVNGIKLLFLSPRCLSLTLTLTALQLSPRLWSLLSHSSTLAFFLTILFKLFSHCLSIPTPVFFSFSITQTQTTLCLS